MTSLLFYMLAALAANMPFLTSRIFYFKTSPSGQKSLRWRLLEWACSYLVLGLFARFLEAQHSPVHQQDWNFYAVTLALFAVLAWPGIVKCYFWTGARAPKQTQK